MLDIRLFGISCRVSLPFFALMALMLLLDQSGMAIHCVLAASIHEMGHLLVMALVRIKPESLTFGLFGVRIERSESTIGSYESYTAISLAGPLINLLTALLFQLCGSSTVAVIHASVGAFNLLPVTPLDGGQALLSLLRMKCEDTTALRISQAISYALLIPLAIVGFLLLIVSGYNLSLLAVSAYLGLLVFFY